MTKEAVSTKPENVYVPAAQRTRYLIKVHNCLTDHVICFISDQPNTEIASLQTDALENIGLDFQGFEYTLQDWYAGDRADKDLKTLTSALGVSIKKRPKDDEELDAIFAICWQGLALLGAREAGRDLLLIRDTDYFISVDDADVI